MTKPIYRNLLAAVGASLLASCGHPALGSDAGPVDAGDTVDAPPQEYPPEPVGLESLAHFERLAYLRPGMHAMGYSSADPSGGNNDQSNYLYALANGETVLFDAVGPGVISRFWNTRDINDHGGTYRFYFDGATTPQITVGREDFWSGNFGPFRAPLSLSRGATSGGYVTFFPISFAKSLLITQTGQRAPDYFNVNYATYSNGAAVATYTGHEDATAVTGRWSHVGENPNAPDPAEVTVTGPLHGPAGERATLATLTGANMITELRVTNRATDDGRAFRGASTFTVSIDPGNDGVDLIRRLDYSVADQTATVSIDGQPVGTWTDAGSDQNRQWRNSTFAIPATFTTGKASIHVTVQFVGSAVDWNEFHYWIDSHLAGQSHRTDELDVGDASSEQQHAYAVTQPTFAGSRTFRYPGAHLARLQIAWDGENTPSVDSPVAELFGTTGELNSPVRALPVGNDDGDFYMFFPMPFRQRATITLSASSGASLQGSYVIRYRPFTDDFARVGTFHAIYQAVAHTTLGKDYVLLDTTGSGHYVGMNLIVPERGGTLEGDERIAIDGCRSAAIHGTGTEDYFNAGWYYEAGSFTTPTHGAPFVPPGNPSATRSNAYRFHIGDLVPFSSSIRVSIEHGPVDDNTLPYASVTYYYATATLHLKKTDAITIGDTESETDHQLVNEGAMPTSMVTARFMTDDATMLTAASRPVTTSTTFTAAIEPQNTGVTLRRLFDHRDAGQTAEVWVDGQLAGLFRTPTANSQLRWYEQDFAIPETFTKDKATLTIKLVVKSPIWNESSYQIFTAKP